MTPENKNTIVIPSDVSKTVENLLIDATVPEWIRSAIMVLIREWETELIPTERPSDTAELMSLNLEGGKVVMRFDRTVERSGRMAFSPASARDFANKLMYWANQSGE